MEYQKNAYPDSSTLKVLKFFGGEDWRKDWRDRFEEMYPAFSGGWVSTTIQKKLEVRRRDKGGPGVLWGNSLERRQRRRGKKKILRTIKVGSLYVKQTAFCANFCYTAFAQLCFAQLRVRKSAILQCSYN